MTNKVWYAMRFYNSLICLTLIAFCIRCSGKHDAGMSELTETAIDNKKSITARELSIWGIYIGMPADSALAQVKKHPHISTLNNPLADGCVVVNVLDDSKKTDYDLFCYTIKNNVVSGISIFPGIGSLLKEGNSGLLSLGIMDSTSAVYKEFLDKADSTVVTSFSDEIRTSHYYFKRGFHVLLTHDTYSDKNSVVFTFADNLREHL